MTCTTLSDTIGYMAYFYIPIEWESTYKSHIVLPNTEATMCSQHWIPDADKYKPSDKLRQNSVLCLSCVDVLKYRMEYEGNAAASLHVFKTVVEQFMAALKQLHG